MAILSTSLNIFGLIFLTHAVYSSHESSFTPTPLPIDIILETLLSVLLLCVGVVLASQPLKPIQWSVWAGQLEKSKSAREVKEVGAGGGNPYAGLEERAGFWDVRGSRKDFQAWVREGEKVIGQ